MHPPLYCCPSFNKQWGRATPPPPPPTSSACAGQKGEQNSQVQSPWMLKVRWDLHTSFSHLTPLPICHHTVGQGQGFIFLWTPSSQLTTVPLPSTKLVFDNAGAGSRGPERLSNPLILKGVKSHPPRSVSKICGTLLFTGGGGGGGVTDARCSAVYGTALYNELFSILPFQCFSGHLCTGNSSSSFLSLATLTPSYVQTQRIFVWFQYILNVPGIWLLWTLRENCTWFQSAFHEELLTALENHVTNGGSALDSRVIKKTTQGYQFAWVAAAVMVNLHRWLKHFSLSLSV